ncbi:MAG: DUF2934 domain-containing protein [Gammaproteobacteria bacterium]
MVKDRVMTEVEQIAESAASKKKKTARKKATGARKAAAKVAGKKPAAAEKITASQIISTTVVTAAERHRLIAETAFLKAERRGFSGGDPVEDWLEAEEEVDESLAR